MHKTFDIAVIFGHGKGVHIVGAALASIGFFNLGYLPELPGYREVLGVPTNVNTARAFFIARSSNRRR